MEGGSRENWPHPHAVTCEYVGPFSEYFRDNGGEVRRQRLHRQIRVIFGPCRSVPASSPNFQHCFCHCTLGMYGSGDKARNKWEIAGCSTFFSRVVRAALVREDRVKKCPSPPCVIAVDVAAFRKVAQQPSKQSPAACAVRCPMQAQDCTARPLFISTLRAASVDCEGAPVSNSHLPRIHLQVNISLLVPFPLPSFPHLSLSLPHSPSLSLPHSLPPSLPPSLPILQLCQHHSQPGHLLQPSAL